jgi:hypothetical protein
MNDSPMGYHDLAVVVPVLNEIGEVLHWIRHIAGLLPGCAVVVADGGSRDGSIEAIRTMQARAPCRRQDAEVADLRLEVVHTRCGRGGQLAQGAGRALKDVKVRGLLFLHVDTALTRQAARSIRTALDDPFFNWGWFDVRLDGPALKERVIGLRITLRARIRHLPQGRQGLLITAEHYRRSGGFKPLAHGEDHEFAARLRRGGRGQRLAGEVITSGRGVRGGDPGFPLLRGREEASRRPRW